MSPRSGFSGHRPPVVLTDDERIATAVAYGSAPAAAADAAHGSPTSSGGRMHEIDGLRAVAVALIVFHHSFTSGIVGTPRPGSGGSLFSAITSSGVELFFVLSGVLLLRPYFRGGRPFRPVTYLRRRIERLWPPYLTALAFAGLVVMAVTVWPTWYSAEVLPHFSAGNWLAQVGILNFGWVTYSGAWWSLTIEVLFYCCVPIVVMAVVWCNSRLRRVAASVLLGLALLVAIAIASPYSPRVADVAAMFAPCFVIGALLAKYRPKRSAGVGLVGFGVAYIALAFWWPQADVHMGFGLFYGGVIILSTLPSTVLNRALSKPFPVWFGERSYSLFLVHFPVFYLANWLASMLVDSRTAQYFLLSRAIGLPLALLLAMAIFWLVERRFARGLATADSFWPPLHSMPELDVASSILELPPHRPGGS